jgi:hypothetical protein
MRFLLLIIYIFSRHLTNAMTFFSSTLFCEIRTSKLLWENLYSVIKTLNSLDVHRWDQQQTVGKIWNSVALKNNSRQWDRQSRKSVKINGLLTESSQSQSHLNSQRRVLYWYVWWSQFVIPFHTYFSHEFNDLKSIEQILHEFSFH